jgi:predicted GNAT family acetyltransferase
MSVTHKKENKKGLFFIEEDNEMIAEMTYTMSSPEILIIDHTEVDEELRGGQLGFQLVEAGVEYARAHHLKIIPLCKFAKAVIDKKMEFHDVLDK